jgi:hypothetical protein
MIKTVENVEYIVLQWSNIPWVWSKEHNVYGVHPKHEQRFIEHIVLLRSLGLLSLSNFTEKFNSLVIVYLSIYVFWECPII